MLRTEEVTKTHNLNSVEQISFYGAQPGDDQTSLDSTNHKMNLKTARLQLKSGARLPPNEH